MAVLGYRLRISRWPITALTKKRYFPGFAYFVIFTGALMGVSIGLQIIASLYQMWTHRVHPVNLSESPQMREARCIALIEEFGHRVELSETGWTVGSPSGSQTDIRSLKGLERYPRHLEINYQQSD